MNISLYPEKSRKDLELDYHHMVATVWEAVADILRLEGQDATEEQIIRRLDTLMRRSEDRAAKSAAVRYQRALMAAQRSAKPVVHLLLAALLLGGVARAQAPDAPSWTKTEIALDAADLTIRTLDLTSTHALLTARCVCWREADFLAPKGTALAPLAAFEYGFSAAVIAGGHELRRHGHPRLALLLTAADLASESWAVQHNLRQHEAKPVPHTGLVAAPVRLP